MCCFMCGKCQPRTIANTSALVLRYGADPVVESPGDLACHPISEMISPRCHLDLLFCSFDLATALSATPLLRSSLIPPRARPTKRPARPITNVPCRTVPALASHVHVRMHVQARRLRCGSWHKPAPARSRRREMRPRHPSPTPPRLDLTALGCTGRGCTGLQMTAPPATHSPRHSHHTSAYRPLSSSRPAHERGLE